MNKKYSTKTTTATPSIPVKDHRTLTLVDRITAFVKSQSYNSNDECRTIFGYDGDEFSFNIDPKYSEKDIPFNFKVTVEGITNLIVKVTLDNYNDGVVCYNFEVESK